MFDNPVTPNSEYEEGTVTEVDILRYACKVKTLSGQNLYPVTWGIPYGGSSRQGDRSTPRIGDRVVIHSGLGYPLIILRLPKPQSTENQFPPSIDTGDTIVDTGNFTSAGVNVLPDQNAPSDMLVGDRVIASEGGGMFALLRGGSILLRSSRMSEIFLSKWDDLVRVVSRNWAHFTDASSEVVRNVGGRVYRYFGAAQTFSKSKLEDYNYHQYTGDVALAQGLKTDLESTSGPAASDVIYKEQVTSGSGGSTSELLSREIHLDGTHDLVVKAGGTFTRIKNDGTTVNITHNDTNVVTIDGDQIRASKGGDPYLVLNSAGVQAKFGDAELQLNSDGAQLLAGGHYCKVSPGGVQLG